MSSSYQEYWQGYSQGVYEASGSYSSTQPQFGSIEQYSSATDSSYDYTQYASSSTAAGSDSYGYNPSTEQYDQSYNPYATSCQGVYDQYSRTGAYTSQTYDAGTYSANADSSNSYSAPYSSGEFGTNANIQYSTTGDSSHQYAPTQNESGSSSQYGASDQHPSSSQYSNHCNTESGGSKEQYRAYGTGGQYSSGDGYSGSEQYSSSTQSHSNSSYTDYNQAPSSTSKYNGSENTWHDSAYYSDSGGGSWVQPKYSSYSQSYSQGSQSTHGQGGVFESSSYKPRSFDYQGGSSHNRRQGRGSYNKSGEDRGSADSQDRGFPHSTRVRGSLTSIGQNKGSDDNRGHTRDQGYFDSNNRGRGSFPNSRDRGRGTYNSHRGRGSHDNSSQGRGLFNSKNRGRGFYDKGSRCYNEKSSVGHDSFRSSVSMGKGGYMQNSSSSSYSNLGNQSESEQKGGPKNWSRPQESFAPEQSSSDTKSRKGESSFTSSKSIVQDKAASGSTNPSKSSGGGSQASLKTATAKPQTTVIPASSSKCGSKTPVFGSGDREPFSHGTRGKTFSTSVRKLGPKIVSPMGESSGTKAVPADSIKQDSKPKSAIEKQAEIALMCAAAFKDVSSPVPEVEIKSTANATTTTKTTSTAKLVPKETESKALDATQMTEEERAHEEEIQRKIKDSIVIIPNEDNPTAEEVDKILKAPPAFEVPEHLKKKLDKMTTHTYCQVCSLVLNAPLQAAQHYQGKNHAKRVRLFIASDGNVSVSKASEVREENLSATGTQSAWVKAEQGEEQKEGETKPAAAVDESKKWECCTLCGVGFTSLKQAEQHYSGKNHAKKVRLSKANACLEKAAEANLVKKGGSNVFECSLCCVMVTSEDQLNTHLQGMKHQNKVKQASGENRPRGRGGGHFRGRRGSRGAFGQGTGEGTDVAAQGMAAGGRGRDRGGFQHRLQQGFHGRRFHRGGSISVGGDFSSHQRFDEGFGFSKRPGFKRRGPFDDLGPPMGKRPRRGF